MILLGLLLGLSQERLFVKAKALTKKKKNGTILATMRDGVAVTLHSSEV